MENSEEEVKKRRYYKIEAGREYTIKRKDIEYNGETITNYTIGFPKKHGNHLKYLYKRVYFNPYADLKNNTKILINDFYEDGVENKKDAYNPIWYIVILDYEVTEEPSDTNDALIEYQNNVNNNEIEERQNNVNNEDLILF